MNRGLLTSGRAAADDLLAKVYGFPVTKAKKGSPLTPGGFDALVIDLLQQIQEVAYGPEKEAIDKALEQLDQDWSTMTKADRTKAIADAGKTFLGLTKGIAPKVGAVIQTAGPAIVVATKKASTAKFKLSIDPTFSAIDEKIVTAAATQQALFVRDQYGVRSTKFSQTARDVVSQGLADGLDRYDIADRLSSTLNTTEAARADSYWQLIAGVFAARARSFGALSSFTEAGITTFTFEAMLDEVTTEICRFMHGKTFSVSTGMSKYEEVAAAPDPEDVKQIQPWAKIGKGPDGGSALFYGSGDSKKMIAAIDSSAYGHKDKVGTYSKSMSPASLQAAGLSTPPLHGLCRSTIVPGETSTVSVPEQVGSPPAPPPPPPAPVPMAPLPPPAPPPPPAVLPANLAELVRPVDVREVDNETLPSFTAAEQAAQAAKERKKKLIEALQNAVDYGPVKAANQKDMPGYVLHDMKMVPKDPGGGMPLPYDIADISASKLAGAKKQKPTTVWVNDLIFSDDHLYGQDVANAFKSPKLDPDKLVLVKVGGELHVWDGQAQAYGAKLKGDATVDAKIIDLDKFALKDAKKKEKEAAAAAAAQAALPPAPAPVAPPAPPPVIVPAAPPRVPSPAKPAPDADTILFDKTGSNKGSNQGGFYTGADGIKRYVKFYDDPTQAQSEHLANSIYNDLGLGAPKSQVFDNKGKTAYASEIFEGGKTIKDLGGPTKDVAKKFMKGFVGDVLTGNWDAIGTGFDNAMVLPDGRVVRIDNGGTFLFRAQAGRKPEGLLNGISEWDVFFSPKNPYYSQVAKKAGYDSPEDMRLDVLTGIKDVLQLRNAHGGWNSYVLKTIPGASEEDRKKIVGMLEARTSLLAEKAAEMLRPPPPAPKPGVARFVGKQYSTVLPKPGLKLEDLPESAVMTDNYEKIDRHSPKTLPSGEKWEDYKKRTDAMIKKIDASSMSAIVDFTGVGYGSIRASEERGAPDSRSNAITKAYEKCEPEPGTVYRGIHSLPRSVIEKYLAAETFQLGKVGGATSSASWLIDVSVDSFMGGDRDGTEGAYKMLFKLNQKTGIPVETVSAVGTSEHEILMGRNAKFRVTGFSRPKGKQKILVVEAEEIVDEKP